MRVTLAFLLLSCGAGLAVEPPSPISKAAQAGDGAIWACGLGHQNQLFSFDGTNWTVHQGPFQAENRAMPMDVVGMRDGAIDCVWKVGDHGVALSRHTATGARVLGTCVWNIPDVYMVVKPMADSQNRLWITGCYPEIYRGGKDGLKLMHQITHDEIAPNYYLESNDPVRTVEDGRGRIWAWSTSLKGIFIFTGDIPELHSTLSTIPSQKVTAIARADDKHMWVAVRGDGIYRVDIDSFAAQRENDPSAGAFALVQELYVKGKDLFALQGLWPHEGGLWRCRESEWVCLVPTLNAMDAIDHPRSWLPVPGGLLIEDFRESAPWYIPDEGTPVHLSWHTGFPQLQAQALIRLKDGSLFSIGQGGEPFNDTLELTPKEENGSRVTDMNSEVPWVVDSAKRVWFIRADAHQILSQWDGEKWIDHTIPGPPEQAQMPPYILPDTEGRLWLQDEGNTGVLHVFDTNSGQWQTFEKLEDAYLQMKDHPPHFLDNSHFIVEPVYSADGKRVAFRRGVAELDYYDGASWQKILRSQMTGEKNDNAVGPPWFAADGSLMVDLRPKTTWRLDSGGKWSKVAFQSHYPSDIWSEDGRGRSIGAQPPEGFVTRNPDSCVMDNLGSYWLTWKGQLYRAVPNHWVALFAPGEVNPFMSPQQLREVFIDARGNALIESAASRMDWFIVRAKAPPPHTTIGLQQEKHDSFLARLDAHTTAAVTFRAQLDDGPWRDAAANSVSLEHLPNGPHVLQVEATDDQLNTDPTPAQVNFSVQIDPASQVAELLTQLSDPDYNKRKEAAEAFALQPVSAEAALRKARARATDEQQWWIDVALQELEAHRSRMPSAGNDTVPGTANGDR